MKVSESRVLRRIFEPMREEVVGGWRRLHSEELHNLYDSPSIIRVIKSRRMRWAGHVLRMGEMRNSYQYWSGNLNGRNHLEDLGEYETLLECILGN
jgi:hypothetical protein